MRKLMIVPAITIDFQVIIERGLEIFTDGPGETDENRRCYPITGGL